MQNQSSFTIYNASAGSGKTFTLVKDYLKVLFKSKSKLAFRNSLALTFTNKAVGEMKARIIDMLKMFSDESILTAPNSMAKVLVEELDIDLLELHEKSIDVLERIIHNYAAFDISTIDKFNHKLIRTFAYDLKLPLNFEVELDTTNILNKAVDKLIDKAGSDDNLTKVLVDFAIEKIDDDKSWDIAFDFNKIAKLLVSENDIPHLELLKHKTLSDFKALKINLQKQLKTLNAQVIAVAENVLTIIENSQLEPSDFTSGYLPKHFIKLSEGNFNVSFSSNWQTDLLEGGSINPKRVSADIVATIENIRPSLIEAFIDTKTAIYQIKFLKNTLNNITPLSVLSAIAKSLDEIKEEDELLLISDFNSIINSEIHQQPAPFIYERIGEKFKHYFIDEFQDTSILQWKNLIPLIDNAISGENLKGETGTALLVGDAKQAIYRWRGGRAEQFIDLYAKKETPFSIQQNVKDLKFNFRSHKTIVEFNNALFQHLSDFAFTNPEHELIYKEASQNVFIDKDGYVELNFLSIDEQDKNELHCKAVLEAITKAERQGFKRHDICIIVRKKKEGIAIANYLSDLDIDIISSETLLLKNAPEVTFIIQLIALSLQPHNDELKVELLSFIAEHLLELSNKHEFFSQLIHIKTSAFFETLNLYGFSFEYAKFLQLPIYEAVESVIRGFHLNAVPNAYIQFFLDEVFDYSQKYNANFSGLLNHWELKKDTLSIVSPESDTAIQIMTIHKAKGLEFPVVIFPFANQDIYADLNPKAWFPIEKDFFEGFSEVYINMNSDLEEFSETGLQMHTAYRSQLELDSINLLYVVLTRAIEQLYVISELDVDKKQNEKLTKYSGVFISFLKSIGKWDSHQLDYHFGTLGKTSNKQDLVKHTINQTQFISTKKEDHHLNIITNSGYLWDTAQAEAIERGNLVHQIMSHIKTKHDVDFALNLYVSSGTITPEQLIELKTIIDAIVNHPLLQPLFDSDLTIYNEKDIISKGGKLFRPDRVVINAAFEATIIDYKTGLQDAKHKEQLFDYQLVLEDMGFVVKKKVLIYINTNIVVKEF